MTDSPVGATPKRPLIRRGFLVLLIVLVGLPGVYLWTTHRLELGKANVDYARKISAGVLQGAEEKRSREGLIRGIAGLFGAKGIADTVLSAGQSTDFDVLVNDARQCDASVARSYGVADLMFFELPLPCQTMLRSLGLPTDMSEITGGFGATLARAADLKPGTIGGPPCMRWRVTSVELNAASRKPSGAPWDGDDSAPDVIIRVESGGKTQTSKKHQNTSRVAWSFPTPITASKVSPFTLRAEDADLLGGDPIIGVEISPPGNLENPNQLRLSSDGTELSFSIACEG